MMENHGLHPVLNDRTDMPYLNSLWRGGTSLDFTHYAALAHPSLPNYLGMTSGFTQATSDSVHPGQYSGPSIWDQLTQAGVSWGIFEEGMPSACSPMVSYNDPVTGGQYLLRHDPGVPYGSVYHSAECQQVQPLTALNYASLPAVSFITPNTCDDMHGLTAAQLAGTGFANCLKGSDALEQRSDQWLSQIVPNLTAAGATVFITFDECCAATLSPDLRDRDRPCGDARLQQHQLLALFGARGDRGRLRAVTARRSRHGEPHPRAVNARGSGSQGTPRVR